MILETASNVPDILANNAWANAVESWISGHMGLSPSISDIFTAVIVVAVFLLLSEVAKHFVTDVAPHLVSRTESTLDDELLKAVKGPIRALIIVAGVYLASKTLNDLDVADAIYRKALSAFKKEGIEIPYPTMTVMPVKA